MNELTNDIGKQECENASNVVRLPLWKACVEDMLKEGVNHGKTYQAEFFETKLKCSRKDMNFGLGVSEIRRVLEQHGMYLSGRGLKGDSFVILPANNNKDVMKSYAAQAVDALKRGVILGTTTRLDLLSPEDRRRHEAMLEKMAMRLALVKHSTKVAKVIDSTLLQLPQKKESESG